MIKNFYTTDAWCLTNNGFELYGKETDKLTAVKPDERQLRFMDMKYYNFIHFGVNTFYDREWGDGKENIGKCVKREGFVRWKKLLSGRWLTFSFPYDIIRCQVVSDCKATFCGYTDGLK